MGWSSVTSQYREPDHTPVSAGRTTTAADARTFDLQRAPDRKRLRPTVRLASAGRPRRMPCNETQEPGHTRTQLGVEDTCRASRAWAQPQSRTSGVSKT